MTGSNNQWETAAIAARSERGENEAETEEEGSAGGQTTLFGALCVFEVMLRYYQDVLNWSQQVDGLQS